MDTGPQAVRIGTFARARGAATSRRVPPPVRAVGRTVVRTVGTGTAALRPLPDFLIIGSKRGGSTSLYRYLLLHPGILAMFPSARTFPLREDLKGVHYFDRNAWRSGLWYRGHFPTGVTRRVASALRRGPVLAGEASPYYLFRPRAAEYAARLVPQARIIALLRNPVDRAFSHWKDRRLHAAEHLSFEEAVAAEPARLAGEEARLQADPRAYSWAHEHWAYLRQGRYADALPAWLECFPRERVFIAASEEFYADPQALYDRVVAFLRLEPYRLPSLGHWNATAGSLSPALRASLDGDFADGNARLAQQLGWDPGWGP